MEWSVALNRFEKYLLLERSLSDHSIEAYVRDVAKLDDFLKNRKVGLSPEKVELTDLTPFLISLNAIGLESSTQARVLSSIRAFFKFLLIEDHRQDDPTELLEAPKLGRKLPDTLSVSEVQAMLGCVKLGEPLGHRNRAILETTYACGLRVSEAVNLKLSNLYLAENFIRVIGKGQKERLIPIGAEAIKHLMNYIHQTRQKEDRIKKERKILYFSIEEGVVCRGL